MVVANFCGKMIEGSPAIVSQRSRGHSLTTREAAEEFRGRTAIERFTEQNQRKIYADKTKKSESEGMRKHNQ